MHWKIHANQWKFKFASLASDSSNRCVWHFICYQFEHICCPSIHHRIESNIKWWLFSGDEIFSLSMEILPKVSGENGKSRDLTCLSLNIDTYWVCDKDLSLHLTGFPVMFPVVGILHNDDDVFFLHCNVIRHSKPMAIVYSR